MTLAPRPTRARSSAPAGSRCCCRPTTARDGRPGPRCSTGSTRCARRRRRRRPGHLRRRAAPRDARAPGPSATASSSRWRGGRSSATCRCSASAAACSCSTSRSAAPSSSTCPTRSATRRTATSPGTFGDHEVRARARARSPRAAAGAERVVGQVPPPPGRRPARRGPGGRRGWSAERRPDRGDRAARPALRARRALAPRGGRAQPRDRRRSCEAARTRRCARGDDRGHRAGDRAR